MAVNLNTPVAPYPPNSRPAAPAAGLLAGAPAVLRIPQMRQNASLRLSKAAAASFSAPPGGIIKPSFASVLRQVISPVNFLKTTGISALFAFPLAAISNFLNLQQGNLTQKQFLVNTVADGCAYTVSGTLASLVGAVIGSLIPIPFLGTAIGMAGGLAVGALLGKLYDDQVRPQFQQTVSATMTQAGLL